MQIRPETQADHDAIRNLTRAAFLGAPHSSGTEAAIIDALRATGALRLSLVAEDAGEVIGHIGFSPVSIGGRDHGWLALGPVAVRPDRQRQGTGKALIRKGLAMLTAQGVPGFVVLGDPAYYRRFGFATDAALWLDGVSPEYFMCLTAGAPLPNGEVTFHPAFTTA